MASDGARLRSGIDAVLALPGRDAHAVFGTPDDLKFRSSLTLFAEAAPDEPLFQAALDRFYDGLPDPLTLRLLRT